MIPTYLLPIFGKDTFPAKNIPKSGLNRIPNLGHFPPPPNHTLYTSLVMSLICMAGMEKGKVQTLPCSSALLVFSLILFSFSFLHFLPLALSYFFMHFLLPWLCLISSSHVARHYGFVFFSFLFLCVSCYVCYFLWFDSSFLHAVPAANTFCCSLFLHISFHSYPFIQKNLGLCEPNNVY